MSCHFDSSNVWLVAEDSESDFVLLRHACSHVTPNLKLQRAKDGIEAKSYLDGEGIFHNRSAYPLPTVVISDLNMPRMNGLGLLGWFRDQPDLQIIPFVLMTGSVSAEEERVARQLKVDEYLMKPGNLVELVQSVQDVADRYGPKAASHPEGIHFPEPETK